MNSLLILTGLLLVASGLAHEPKSKGETKPENKGKGDDTKVDQLRPGGAGRGGDREPSAGGGDDHGKRGVNERPGMEPANVGVGPGREPGDNRGGEPDPSPGDREAEPVTPEPAPEPEPEPEPEPTPKATPKKRAKKTAEKPAENEEESE